MTKNALLTCIALCSIALLAGESALADEQELAEVRATVSAMFEEIDAEHIQPSPVEGWYTIRKGAIVAYISGDGRYLLQGDMIDLVSQTNLSESARNGARAKLMASVSEEEVITFSPENVRHTVSVFTDIDCTFCRRLHNQIDEYMAEGIAVRYFLYPRNGPTSASWATAEHVWCANDRNKALTTPPHTLGFDRYAQNASSTSST